MPILQIKAIEHPEYVEFRIKDNGIGIATVYHQQVFEPFKKLHHKSKYEGAGIGLSICKKIVVLHGGKIWVESEEGKGSIFCFLIKK